MGDRASVCRPIATVVLKKRINYKMSYRRIDPPNELCRLIECYWIIDNPDTVSVEQKIIPDGFPEIILHYGDPFMIRLGSEWELQSRGRER